MFIYPFPFTWRSPHTLLTPITPRSYVVCRAKCGIPRQGVHILYMKMSGNLGLPVFVPSFLPSFCSSVFLRFSQQTADVFDKAGKERASCRRRRLHGCYSRWLVGCAQQRGRGASEAAAAVSSFMPRPLSKELYAREMNTPLVWTPPPPPLDNELSALSASC